MPPTNVCPQCKAAVPVRRKTCVTERCDHVFRSKRKADFNLREKAMKRMRSVESDSVKSAREAQEKPLSPQGDTQMSKFYWYQCVRYCIAHLINGSVLSKLDTNSWTEQGSP